MYAFQIYWCGIAHESCFFSGGRLSTLGDVQRFSDQEATDQATLELALQESRRLYANRDYDDLETSLLLSISSSTPTLPSAAAASSTFDRESKVQDAIDTDILAVQGELLRSVTEQSEREYLDTAIVSSLVDGGQSLTEEEIINKAILSSFAASDRSAIDGNEGYPYACIYTLLVALQYSQSHHTYSLN